MPGRPSMKSSVGSWHVRRAVLVGLGGAALGALWPPRALASTLTRVTALLAAWSERERQFVGVLGLHGGRLQVRSRIEVPTRAHGLVAEPGGSVLAVARRPGDWLLRWHPRSGHTQWAWAEPGSVFNGHALVDAERRRVLTTETDTDNGAGQIALRDLHTLECRARWPSAGLDPHALLLHQGRLWVANGGIPTQPETGRVKRDLHRMDSSLVVLDPADGALHGKWCLPDARLSLRHLAADGQRIGVALQAEHDDPAERQHAPLLAVWDGHSLRLPTSEAAAPPVTGGYGGDVAAFGAGFAVSATRAQGVVTWRPGEGWRLRPTLAEAGALAGVGDRLWVAGSPGALELREGSGDAVVVAAAIRLDNHWVPIGA